VSSPTYDSQGVTAAESMETQKAPGAWLHGVRGLLLGIIGLALFSGPDVREAAIVALSDSYLQVTSFVAGTLFLVWLVEHRIGGSFGAVIDRYPRWQVPAAALFGAFPGCGGAIVVITNYARGHMSFGSVVAVLTATMGDAAFVLIAQAPEVGLAMIGLGVVVGLVSGLAVDLIHGKDFLRPSQSVTLARTGPHYVPSDARGFGPMALLWTLLIVPGIVLGVMGAFQLDVDAMVGWPLATTVGLAGVAVALTMWVLQPRGRMGEEGVGGARIARAPRILRDTNMVTAWVVMSFLGYEVLVAGTGYDLSQVFTAIAPLVPAIAILVGFIPGCGPQLVVTTLYVSGAVPLSAQIGNAISNDGDALFPAIAALPKAALVATLYSAVPAAMCAYGWFFLVEHG